MGFKDFCEQNKQTSENFEQIDEKTKIKAERQVEHMYKKYKDKSEDELISELYKNIEKQKENGTFNYEQICNMAKKISPFLNDEQKLRMKELLEKIK